MAENSNESQDKKLPENSDQKSNQKTEESNENKRIDLEDIALVQKYVCI